MNLRRWGTLVSVLALVALLGSACSETLVPGERFFDSPLPDPPDYGDEAAWAALPWAEDPADVVPRGEADGQADARADVFFVHPTTFISRSAWNEPLDDRGPGAFLAFALRNQASAFNAGFRVFAPRYRQATLGVYTTSRTGDARQAMDLAYSDVRAAFAHYLAEWNQGRPMVIAGHSQGSDHAKRLLSEFFSDLAGEQSLAPRLVVAYLVGAAVPVDATDRIFPSLEPCGTSVATGCVVSWNTVGSKAALRDLSEKAIWYPTGWEAVTDPDLLCTNPLKWGYGPGDDDRAQHRGAVRFNGAQPRAQPDKVQGSCSDGLLVVETELSGLMAPGDDYHFYDYQLFYMDIRHNALERSRAFAGRRSRGGVRRVVSAGQKNRLTPG